MPGVKEWGHLNGTARAFYAKPRKVEPCFFLKKDELLRFVEKKKVKMKDGFCHSIKKLYFCTLIRKNKYKRKINDIKWIRTPS